MLANPDGVLLEEPIQTEKGRTSTEASHVFPSAKLHTRSRAIHLPQRGSTSWKPDSCRLGSPQSVKHVIGFDELDLPTTIDVNTQRGFRFVLRNEPLEQYLRDHPDQAPPLWSAPKN